MQHTISSAQPDEVFKGTPVDEFSEQKSTIELEEKLHTIDVIEQAFVADDVDQTNGNGIMQRAQEWQSFISSVEKSFPVQVKRLADLPSSARINFGGLFISCALSIFWDSKMSTHVEESEIGSDFTLSLVDWITSATSVVIESVLCCAPQESVALRQILSMHMPPFQDTRPDSLPKTECFITFLSSPMNSGDNEAAFQTYLGVHPCLAPLPLVVYLRDCIVLLILHSSNDNRVYNARTREVMFLIAESFAMDSDAIRSFEITVGETLHSYENISSAEGRVSRSTKFAQRAKIVGATVGGGILLAVTAGLALPAIAAGVASLGIGLSSIGLGAVGSALVGTSIVMSSLGVGGAMIVFGGVGASLTGIKLSKRFGDLDIDGFKFRRLRKLEVDNRPDTSTDALEIVIGISGYITSSREFGEPWKCIRNRNSGLTDVYVLHWEKKNLLKLGSVVLKMVTTEVAGALTNAWLNFTLGAAAAPAVFPVMIVSSMSDLDNAWLVVRDRAYQAGEALAYSLTNEGVVGLRPVTLIGYSMGSVVIFACLQALADAGQFHRVQNVILMGAPIPATFAFESQRLPWKKAKSAVSGRFVNCHSSKDSLLGFLCRVVDWGLAVAGLSAVNEDGIENFDVKDILQSHSEYPTKVEDILQRIHFIRMSDPSVPDLHELAKMGSVKLEEVLECGDISKSISMCSSKDKHSRTPLHLAAFGGHISAVQTLLKYKADVDAMAMDGFTALHFASQTGHADVVKVLLESKANINRCLFKSKRSPLHIACAKYHEDVIELLVKKGIDASLKTRQNQTALDLISDVPGRYKVDQLIAMKSKGKRHAPDNISERVDQNEGKTIKIVYETQDIEPS